MRQLPDKSINLVITSPPFALQRQKEYGNKTQCSLAMKFFVIIKFINKYSIVVWGCALTTTSLAVIIINVMIRSLLLVIFE